MPYTIKCGEKNIVSPSFVRETYGSGEVLLITESFFESIIGRAYKISHTLVVRLKVNLDILYSYCRSICQTPLY